MSKSHTSRIVAGVMHWGQWGAQLDTQQMARLIEDCTSVGVTTFDHADIYGGHTTEAEWGRAFTETGIDRQHIQIVSKCGIMMPSPQRAKIRHKHYDTSTGHIIHSVDTSLRNLKTEYLDLLLIHRPSPLMDPTEIMKAVDHLKSSGKIKKFGVSNFSPSQMQLLSTAVDISANQIEVSPLKLDPFTDGTLDYCMMHHVRPMAWSPLGGGRLFGALTHPLHLNRRYRLQTVADKYGWTLDELAYLFVLHHPSDIQVVTGSSKIERIQVAVDAAHTIISDAQWFEIYSASTGVNVP